MYLNIMTLYLLVNIQIKNIPFETKQHCFHLIKNGSVK